jgi:hypothetical protein
MSRSLKAAVLGLVLVAVVLVFGSRDGAKAATQALDAPGSSAAQPIYPAGGSDGPTPPNL